MELGIQPMRATSSTLLPLGHPHVPRSISRCGGQATQEKMGMGTKDRPQGMLTGQLVRLPESSKSEEP